MTEPTTPRFIVHPPFDAESTGDCIIQSVDGAEFHVHRAILSMASTVFRDMFDMPSTPSGTTEEPSPIPVIPVQEDGETLQALLRLMHPIDPPSIKSLQFAQQLVTACDKYFISTAKLRIYLRGILSEEQCLKEEPLTCYGLSWKLGLEQEAIRASRYTHFVDLTDISVANALFSCSGGLEAMLTLWRMRNTREDALEGLLSLVQPRTYGNCSLDRYGNGHRSTSIIVGDYIRRRAQLKESLKSPYPKCEKVEDFLVFQITGGASGCSTCTESAELGLKAIKLSVIEALEKYPQQISGPLPPQPSAKGFRRTVESNEESKQEVRSGQNGQYTSMSNSASAQFIVQPPFDSGSVGDCILRTPDGTEFKVVKAILYLGSTIFRDMFDIPQASNASENKTDIPVVPVEEDPETIQTLLQVLYPVEPPSIKSLSLARKLVTACDKYFVNNAKVRLHLKEILSKSQSLDEDPLTCYSLSWRLRLEEEAIAASRYTHSVNLSDKAVAQNIVSASGSLEAFACLWDLKFRREKALDQILTLATDKKDMACGHHTTTPGSFKDYSIRKDDLRVALMVPRPVCKNVETFLGFQAGTGEAGCRGCHYKRLYLLAGSRENVMEALASYPQAIQGYVAP
ncbi:hypothetical protein FS837_002888 [Tulasnella sp. UAMH 9824]|nr:hypothetical protein FS837_002888 [Tulasnella sp. UAMH 9824]